MNTIGIDLPMLAAGFITWLIILSGFTYLLYDRVKQLEEQRQKD